MKKRAFVFLLTISLLTGCSNNASSGEHVHTYASTYSYDKAAHWYDATCGHSYKKGYATHTFTDWSITKIATETEDGSMYRKCTVCPYTEIEVIPASGEEGGSITPSHTHTFYSSWTHDDTYHWHAASCGHNVVSNKAVHTYGSWIIEKEATATEDGRKHKTCSTCSYSHIETIPATGVEPDEQAELDSIQDMNVLHAWDWKLNDIKARLKRIKKLGYGAIQTSPMQPHVDGKSGSDYDTRNNWWKLYQPLGFQVATGTQNILGTKEDLTSLCSAAEIEGIKIVVDVVCNHLAGSGSGYNGQVFKQYPLHEGVGKSNDNSIQAVVQGHIGLPDLDTSNKELQNDVLSMMKEYIDCGVSGFRFDAAKHIETPDDGEYASDFWPTVLNGTTTYALSKGHDKPYYYGEILGTCGKDRSFDSYTQFMSIVESEQGGDVLLATKEENAGMLYTEYMTKQSPDHLMLWAESHDNYANDDKTTRGINVLTINRAYMIQASRKDVATLYYARPSSMDAHMCAIEDNGGWQYDTVKAINKFHDRYVDKSENISINNNCFVNVRGTGSYAGAAIICLRSDYTSRTVDVALNNGTYVDLVSTNEYTVSGGRVTVSLTDGACILIPQSAYVPEEEDPSYVSSLVIEDAPSDKVYKAWVWGSGASSWRSFSNDHNALGLSLSSGEQFTIVEFPGGTSTPNWDNMIRQTVDMSYSGTQQVIPFNSLTWRSS